MRVKCVILFLGIVLMCSVFQGCSPKGERLCIRRACFDIEVMKNDEGRTKGLMFRKGLSDGKGMFFVFDSEAVYPFWMKNMNFPIDILWLDEGLHVVHIASNVPPCSSAPCPVYTPAAKAMFVLEIPSGTATKNGLSLGDIADIKL